MLNFFLIMVFIGAGLLVEKLIKNKFLAKHFQLNDTDSHSMDQAGRVRASLINEIPDVIGLFLFFGFSYTAFMLFEFSDSPIVQLTFMATIITISLIRSASIVSKMFLSPAVREFRMLPVDCSTANTIHRLIVISFSYIVTALMFAVVVQRLGAQQTTVLLLQLFFATLLLTVMAVLVFVFRIRIRDYIVSSSEVEQECWGIKPFAAVWHILAILYLISVWLLLINNFAFPGNYTKGAFLVSVFIVPIWMICDKVIQWIIHYGFSTLKLHEDHYDDEEDVEEEVQLARENGRIMFLRAKSFARFSLIIALGIWIAGLWNIKIPFVSNLAAVTIDALIIMTLALIFWRFISNWIERKIQESIPEGEEENKEDDEWGGAANRGRSYTLLPMIRKFIASVLVIMVTMTILSSMGVDIGPLLAGAGVVGLAVGFGAQKLVSDMFSGFFYLLDDAFRVGEYLTAGDVSGTVEAITLRNVMLRHHRGMLQIVPHSELGAITNYMRGGMVVKFNLDFPYDANIDKIRKIIKKVGIAMLDDEELGKDFIRPVKSQGVREITNSVMTIRVKFTAKPGAHFVIRREAFKRITEALKKAGIEYAHRKVIVDVPGLSENGNEKLTPEQAKQVADAAGAAALASEQPAEQGTQKPAAENPAMG